MCGSSFTRICVAGGTRPTQLADAVKADLEEQGQTVDEAHGEIGYARKAQKRRKPIPTIKAHLDRIKPDAAKKRAKSSADSAKEAGPADLASFVS